MPTTVAVVDLEKVFQQSTHIPLYAQEWENGEELKNIKTDIENLRKTLSNYKASIGNAPMTYEDWEWGDIDYDAVRERSSYGSSYGFSSFAFGGYPRKKVTVWKPTAEAKQISAYEQSIRDKENSINVRREAAAQNNTVRVRNEINEILKQYIAKKGIDLVLDAHHTTVLFMTDAVEITDEILAIHEGKVKI